MDGCECYELFFYFIRHVERALSFFFNILNTDVYCSISNVSLLATFMLSLSI